MNEQERIRRVYEERDRRGKRDAYSLRNPSTLLAVQQRERQLVASLPRDLVGKLATTAILDVGCGNGGQLRDLVRFGAAPENCYGVDLLPFRIDEAAHLSPNMHFMCANGEWLEYPDRTFGLVLCFTVFSSVFDANMRANLASEMVRVLAPGGVVLWYDFLVNNPRNPDVRGVPRREIRRLFPGCQVDFKRITLAPPLARALAPRSVAACQILERIPWLCTHCLCVIRPQAA